MFQEQSNYGSTQGAEKLIRQDMSSHVSYSWDSFNGLSMGLVDYDFWHDITCRYIFAHWLRGIADDFHIANLYYGMALYEIRKFTISVIKDRHSSLMWKKIFELVQTMEVDTIQDTVQDKEEDKLTIDNTPTPGVLSKYRLAGNFCSLAIKSVLSLCVPGANCAELCRIGDVAILSQVQLFSRPSDE